MTRLPDWLDPWSANRRLRAQLSAARAELADAGRMAEIACEQYDRLREANAELRDALNMLRRDYIEQRDYVDAEAAFEWLSGVMGAEEDE